MTKLAVVTLESTLIVIAGHLAAAPRGTALHFEKIPSHKWYKHSQESLTVLFTKDLEDSALRIRSQMQ